MANRDPYYKLTLRDGTRYVLAEGGEVLARSNGPRGWNYSGEWIVLGFTTRHNAHRIISLADALAGANIGQGWVHDLDHGTHRMWGSPTGRRFGPLIRFHPAMDLPIDRMGVTA